MAKYTGELAFAQSIPDVVGFIWGNLTSFPYFAFTSWSQLILAGALIAEQFYQPYWNYESMDVISIAVLYGVQIF